MFCDWTEFHSFVRPTERPKLTDFCTELTGITQTTVDSAPILPTVLIQLYAFLKQHKLTFASTTSKASAAPALSSSSSSFTCCWVSDGQADFHHFLYAEMLRKRLPVPPALFSHYCDIRLTFMEYFPHCSRAYLSRMLREVGLKFAGRPHSGLDDARNIARLLIEVAGRGGVVKCNSQLPAH